MDVKNANQSHFYAIYQLGYARRAKVYADYQLVKTFNSTGDN
jgi:hypothetical protein